MPTASLMAAGSSSRAPRTARSASIECGGTDPSALDIKVSSSLMGRPRPWIESYVPGPSKFGSEARVLLGQPLHVFPHRALEAWIPQARGGGIGDQELGGAETIDLPPHGCHGSPGPDEQFGREFAEAADDLGTQDRELPQEIGRAGLDLVGQGIAVLRRTALQNVADVDGLTTDGDAGDELALVHGGENLGEQLAGAAYEGLAASIL